MKKINYRYNKKTNVKIMMDRLLGNTSETLVIPHHQRDYVWNDKGVRDLLESSIKGYPIGSITVKISSGKYVLQDGLQRHFSFRKIQLNAFKYIDYKIIKIKNKVDYDEEVFNLYKNVINKYLAKDTSNKKILNLEIDDVIEWIKKPNEKNIEKSILYKKLFSNIKDIHTSIVNLLNWVDSEEYDLIDDVDTDEKYLVPKGMMSIIVPHIELLSFEERDVKKIFEYINNKGKTLSDQQILASEWSSHKINIIGETHDAISTYHRNREDKYKNAIGVKKSSKISKYSDTSIIPSNFIAAVLLEALSKTEMIKKLYFNTSCEILSQSDEAALEIVKSAFDEVDIKTSDKEFGNIIDKHIDSKKDIDNIIKKIQNSAIKLEEAVPMFRYFKSNNQNGYSVITSVWLITSLLITLIKGGSDVYLEKWFNIETFLNSDYVTSPSIHGKKMYQEKELVYSEEPKISLDIKKIIEEINKTEDYNNNWTKITNKAKIILGLIQGSKITHNSRDLEIDHLIPQNSLKLIPRSNFNLNSLWNLSLLSRTENRKKSDMLDGKTLRKYDFVYNWLNKEYNDEDKFELISNYEGAYENVLKKVYIGVLDNDGNAVTTGRPNKDGIFKAKTKGKDFRPSETEVKKFLELRSVIMCKIIEQYFN